MAEFATANVQQRSAATLTVNREIVWLPTQPSTRLRCSPFDRGLPYKQVVGGSSPSAPTLVRSFLWSVMIALTEIPH
jgi:hypothetical protein